MATASTIVGLLNTTLSALASVDQSSTEHYLPPIKTNTVALVIPPFEQRTQIITPTVTRGTRIKYHNIRCEFWVKLNAGEPATAITNSREIGLQAIEALLVDDALNNSSYKIGHFGDGTPQSIEADVAPVPVTVGGVDYIVVTVFVPIVDYSD